MAKDHKEVKASLDLEAYVFGGGESEPQKEQSPAQISTTIEMRAQYAEKRAN